MISIKDEISLQEFIQKENKSSTEFVYTFQYPCKDDYSNCFPYEITFSPGFYFLECWGAAGSTIIDTDKNGLTVTANGGKGGYSSGVVVFQKTNKLYLHIGGSANITNALETSQPLNNTYNGCLNDAKNIYDGMGGGATDFRTKSGNWSSNFDSRIIVAGGGGAGRAYIHSTNVNFTGGDGGGVEGEPGIGLICDSGYGTIENYFTPQCSNSSLWHGNGSFGYGYGGEWSGGGGGYYGGGSVFNGAGGGGSGYIGNLQSIGKYIAKTSTSSHNGFGYAKITILTDTKFISQFLNTCNSNNLFSINHSLMNLIFFIML